MATPTEIREEGRLEAKREAWERMNVTDCDVCPHGWFVITDRGGSSYGESTEPPWFVGYCACQERTEEGISDDGNCLCDTATS